MTKRGDPRLVTTKRFFVRKVNTWLNSADDKETFKQKVIETGLGDLNKISQQFGGGEGIDINVTKVNAIDSISICFIADSRVLCSQSLFFLSQNNEFYFLSCLFDSWHCLKVSLVGTYANFAAKIFFKSFIPSINQETRFIRCEDNQLTDRRTGQQITVPNGFSVFTRNGEMLWTVGWDLKIIISDGEESFIFI